MNIKLHTPKSLKSGSGMGSLKQFLLSLLATTVSIALTFGTAAVVDYNKKQSEKHEIVMMVMYDMHNSLKQIVSADSLIQQSMAMQLELSQDTSKFGELYANLLLSSLPEVEYTETTEHIFSSSIETINTVANVLFAESVADFYALRQKYKAMVVDSIYSGYSRILSEPATLSEVLGFNYRIYALSSVGLSLSMKELFAQCKLMMEVSDEELEAYTRERNRIDEKTNEKSEIRVEKMKELNELQNQINENRAKLKLK